MAVAPSIAQIQVHRGGCLQMPGRCVTLAVAWNGAEDPPRLLAGLASLLQHPALGQVVPAGALEGLRAAGPAGAADRAVGFLACLLQRALGHALPAGREAGRVVGPGRIFYPVWDVSVGTQAGRAAVALVAALQAAADEHRRQAAHELFERLLAHLGAIDLSESARRIVETAERRGIPWDRLVPLRRLYRLGEGARQVRLMSSYTPQTSHLATHLSQQKDLASQLLRRHGLPAAVNRRVGSAEEAVAAAAAIGYPVVVKPVATDFGTAVSLDNGDAAEVRQAYAEAARYGAVVVERQIAGQHTRLLVLHGRFVSAVTQQPAHVVGDGRQSVAALIAAANATRGDALSSTAKKIAVDAEARQLLARQGLGLESVPAAGHRVALRHTSNASRGGTRQNVTRAVHPDNARLAERASAVIGLDCAGVDLITPDVTRSFRDVGGAICEINAGPGLYMEEPTNLVFESFLDGLFDTPEDGRIPVVCVLGEDVAAVRALVRAVADRAFPGRAGLALVSPGAFRIGDWPVPQGSDFSLHEATRLALSDPGSSALLLHLTPQGVAQEGLAFERCDLAVLAPSAAALPPDVVALVRGRARRSLEAGEGTALAAALAEVAAR